MGVFSKAVFLAGVLGGAGLPTHGKFLVVSQFLEKGGIIPRLPYLVLMFMFNKNSTGVEVELKFLLSESPEKFIGKFDDRAKHAKRVYQKTVMFDNDQKLMQKTNGRIRLRQSGDIVTISYKLPLSSSEAKKEIEWETKIDGWKIGESIIKAMGFKETTSYEKYRTSFSYKDVQIEVDEYPFANFVEIEGEEEKIGKVANELGLDIKTALKDPCDTLFTKWRLARGLPMNLHMRFEDYDK